MGLSGDTRVGFSYKYDHFDLVLITKQLEMIKLNLVCLSVTLKSKYRLLTHTDAGTYAHGAQWWEGKFELFEEWDNRSPGIVAINEWIDGWTRERGEKGETSGLLGRM